MLKLLIALCLVLFMSSAFAADEETAGGGMEGPGVFVQLAGQHVVGVEKISGVQAYVESPVLWKSVDGNQSVSVFSLGFVGNDESKFHELQIGPVWKIGNLQIGLGVGKAIYDKVSHVVTSPFVYYASDKFEALGTIEHYSHEPDPSARIFYKGFAQYKAAEHVAVGAHIEQGIGFGPRVSYKVAEGLSIWGSIPVVHRAEGAKFVLGFVFEHSF